MKSLQEHLTEALIDIPTKRWPKTILDSKNQSELFKDTRIEEKDWRKVSLEIIQYLSDVWGRIECDVEEEHHTKVSDARAAAEEYFWNEVRQEPNDGGDNDFSFNFKDFLSNNRNLKGIDGDWNQVWYNFKRVFGF